MTTIAACDAPEALPDLETVDARATDTPISAIEDGFVTWLDLTSNKEPTNMPVGTFALQNPSPRLFRLEGGWLGDPVSRTVGIGFLHRGPSKHLRETTLVGGRNGETALLSTAYPGTSLEPMLVIRDADGSIRVPLMPVGPEEAAIAGCLDVAASKNDFDGVLDCLGLLSPGGGSPAGGLFPPGWEGLGAPDCTDGGIAMGGIAPSGSPDSLGVRMWMDHAVESLGGKTYGPVTEGFREAVQNLVDAGKAWEAANAALEAAPSSEQAQQELLDALGDFDEAAQEFEDAAHKLIDENYAGEPLPDDQATAKDPRCLQQAVDTARGTLFANPDFCTSDDLLTCLAEEVDSIRKITDGKCATVESPLGGKTLRCNDAQGGSLETDLGALTDPASADPLHWTDPNSPPSFHGKVHFSYVDTLDLGHVLIGLCAAGGCPQDPRAL